MTKTVSIHEIFIPNCIFKEIGCIPISFLIEGIEKYSCL